MQSYSKTFGEFTLVHYLLLLFSSKGEQEKVSSSKLLDRKFRRLSEAEDCVLVLYEGKGR